MASQAINYNPSFPCIRKPLGYPLLSLPYLASARPHLLSMFEQQGIPSHYSPCFLPNTPRLGLFTVVPSSTSRREESRNQNHETPWHHLPQTSQYRLPIPHHSPAPSKHMIPSGAPKHYIKAASLPAPNPNLSLFSPNITQPQAKLESTSITTHSYITYCYLSKHHEVFLIYICHACLS